MCITHAPFLLTELYYKRKGQHRLDDFSSFKCCCWSDRYIKLKSFEVKTVVTAQPENQVARVKSMLSKTEEIISFVAYFSD